MIYKEENMLKKIMVLLLSALIIVSVTACNSENSTKNIEENVVANKDTIVIWTSGEDYRNDAYLKGLKEKFPDYNFQLEYMNTSTIASKLLEEGKNSICDIVLSEEYGYLDMIKDNLVSLEGIIDYNEFLDDIVPELKKWTPELKNGGCIMVNKKLLEEKSIPIPTSYNDLLNEKYKNLISMPSPASSGTGYMFLRQLTNEWGEDKAFDYFSKLTNNILQYTSSGSGPVNQLIQGEVAIAIGMTSQGVTEKNNGVDLEIIFFEEGSPFSMYGNAIVAKDNIPENVYQTFKYLSTDLCKQNNELYFPDQIYKNFVPVVKGYPTNIKYGNMSNDTRSEKERLLKKWTFS